MPAHLGLAIYAACVDFMVHAANLTGTTYRDANAFMFFVLWPLVTAALAVIVIAQGRRLRRLRRRAGAAPGRGVGRGPETTV
jgi:hypothetical protein